MAAIRRALRDFDEASTVPSRPLAKEVGQVYRDIEICARIAAFARDTILPAHFHIESLRAKYKDPSMLPEAVLEGDVEAVSRDIFDIIHRKKLNPITCVFANAELTDEEQENFVKASEETFFPLLPLMGDDVFSEEAVAFLQSHQLRKIETRLARAIEKKPDVEGLLIPRTVLNLDGDRVLTIPHINTFKKSFRYFLEK